MVIWGGIFQAVLIGVTLLCLPAAGFLLELYLKISPTDNTSQYHTQKINFIYCFLSSINVKLFVTHDACPSLLVWCHG
jgi:hypothetical protein